MYKIYKHTMPDGKSYIGYTGEEKPYVRWQYGNGYKNQTRFFEDILQVGWNNIQHEILEEVETKREAEERERYYILLYRSNEPDFGYNINADKMIKAQMRPYIRCVETGEVFESMVAAGEKYGVSGEAIRTAINRKYRSANKHWEKITMTREEYQLIRSGFDLKEKNW